MTARDDNKQKLASLIERYRRSPEFMLVNLDDINQRGMTGDTLLHAAVVRGALDDVEILIAAGAKVNAIGDLGNTPLHHAASRGLGAIARRLLDRGADPNLRNEFGQSPSDVARIMKHAHLAQVLKRQ
jgi:uncharacterized protein